MSEVLDSRCLHEHPQAGLSPGFPPQRLFYSRLQKGNSPRMLLLPEKEADFPKSVPSGTAGPACLPTPPPRPQRLQGKSRSRC